jgi:hypothetical protein
MFPSSQSPSLRDFVATLNDRGEQVATKCRPMRPASPPMRCPRCGHHDFLHDKQRWLAAESARRSAASSANPIDGRRARRVSEGGRAGGCFAVGMDTLLPGKGCQEGLADKPLPLTGRNTDGLGKRVCGYVWQRSQAGGFAAEENGALILTDSDE